MRTHRGAFTLVEMVTTVAALVIVLGVMVSLARYVRDQSSNELTKDLLRRLDAMVVQYMAAHDGEVPEVTELIGAPSAATRLSAPSASAAMTSSALPDETELARAALENSEQFVHALVAQVGLARSLTELSAATYDRTTVRDAWGMPIVLMRRGHPLIGMAPRDRHFFLSAGADRKFLTRADNLYSYEISASPRGR
jgi:hypothetical protein